MQCRRLNGLYVLGTHLALNIDKKQLNDCLRLKTIYLFQKYSKYP